MAVRKRNPQKEKASEKASEKATEKSKQKSYIYKIIASGIGQQITRVSN